MTLADTLSLYVLGLLTIPLALLMHFVWTHGLYAVAN